MEIQKLERKMMNSVQIFITLMGFDPATIAFLRLSSMSAFNSKNTFKQIQYGIKIQKSKKTNTKSVFPSRKRYRTDFTRGSYSGYYRKKEQSLALAQILCGSMKSSLSYSKWFKQLPLGSNWPTSSRASYRVGC